MIANQWQSPNARHKCSAVASVVDSCPPPPSPARPLHLAPMPAWSALWSLRVAVQARVPPLASPWPCLNVTSAETRGRACSRPTVVARPPLAVEQLGARGRPRHRSEQRIIAPPSRAFDRRCSCSCRLKSGGRQKFLSLSHGVFSPDFPSSPTHFVCLSLSHTHFVD